MTRIILFLLLVLTSCTTKTYVDDIKIWGESDTILVTNQTPIGTQILPKSEKTMQTLELALYYLDSVGFTECSSSIYELNYIENHSINSIVKSDSSLIVDFNVNSTCSSDFLCEVELLNDSTLNLIYHQYNSYASCNCCFGLSYWFKIVQDDQFDESDIQFLKFNGTDQIDISSIQ